MALRSKSRGVDKNLSFLVDRYRVGLDGPAAVPNGRAGTQIENKSVKRTDHLVFANDAVGQWPLPMRTPGLSGEHAAASGVEYRNGKRAGLEYAPFPSWDRSQIAHSDDASEFSSDCH
jgi:hypothetical protein